MGGSALAALMSGVGHLSDVLEGMPERPFIANTGSRGSSNDAALWPVAIPVAGAVHRINSGPARIKRGLPQYNGSDLVGPNRADVDAQQK